MLFQRLFKTARIDDSKKSESLVDLLPRMFLDPITGEPLRPQDLVITIYGDCFNRQTIQQHWAYQLTRSKTTNCPLRSYPLNESFLLTKGNLFEKVSNILQDVQEKLISKETDLSTFPNFLAKNEEELKRHLAIMTRIYQMKQKAKLDFYSSEHIQFWANDQTFIKRCLIRRGSDKLLGVAGYKVIYLENQKIVISENIFKLMQLAGNLYDSETQFENTLNRELEARRRNHFFCTISKAEARLLNSDIRSVSLSQ